jgi:hypothetical protein
MSQADLLAKLERLEATDDPIERNALSIELSDTHDPRVFDVLVRLIQRPQLENNRGTLVYCLENYDCSPIADLLIELSETGNLEVRMQADMILKEQALR